MKKVLLGLIFVVSILFIVSCTPQEEISEEELSDALNELSDEELQEIVDTPQENEDSALAGQATRTRSKYTSLLAKKTKKRVSYAMLHRVSKAKLMARSTAVASGPNEIVCDDTDGGWDLFERGQIQEGKWPNGTSFHKNLPLSGVDTCIKMGTRSQPVDGLKEFRCPKDENDPHMWTNVICTNGCADGACKEGSVCSKRELVTMCDGDAISTYTLDECTGEHTRTKVDCAPETGTVFGNPKTCKNNFTSSGADCYEQCSPGENRVACFGSTVFQTTQTYKCDDNRLIQTVKDEFGGKCPDGTTCDAASGEWGTCV